MKTAIIGAGAAGCFCATLLRRLHPEMQIVIYESGRRPMQKLAITGGGRCNLTNTFEGVRSLQRVYPRGHQLMGRLLKRFDQHATMRWWEDAGVRLVVQDDHCVFPLSQDAMEIVGVLLKGIGGAQLRCSERVATIVAEPPTYRILTDRSSDVFDCVVVTTGGAPKASGLGFLDDLELKRVPPVPSLFSFNLAAGDGGPDPVTRLMGLVAAHAETRLAGTSFRSEGPLLVTHWGMSGPAILRLSSVAARWLAEHDYRATLSVGWIAGNKEDDLRAHLQSLLADNPRKQVGSLHMVTGRLWQYLLYKASIAPDRRCSEVGSKQLNRLAAMLCNDTYTIAGQSRHKEEFVTCGGVSLDEVDSNTLESKRHPGLYLAGEVLDVDGITGGFNLQAAWTMARTVALAISASHGLTPEK